MLALISPAKSMLSVAKATEGIFTQPRLMESTRYIVSLMVAYSVAELQQIFKVSHSIASELKTRFEALAEGDNNLCAALDCYDGVVYKHIKQSGELSAEDRAYLQNNLRISSLLYGLLRPLDAIKPYRMEALCALLARTSAWIGSGAISRLRCSLMILCRRVVCCCI